MSLLDDLTLEQLAVALGVQIVNTKPDWHRRYAWREYRHGRMKMVSSGACMTWAVRCLKDAAFCRNHNMLDSARVFVKEARAWRKLASTMLAGRLQ